MFTVHTGDEDSTPDEISKKESYKRRKPGSLIAIEQQKVDLMKQRMQQKLDSSRDREKDEDYHFMMSVLPSIRSMNNHDKLKFRIEMLQLIDKYKPKPNS